MKKIFTIFVFMAVAMTATAQDPHFSQYYASPLYLNPGFTGAMPVPRLILNSRIQWTGLPKAFSTYAISGDVYVDRFNSGFGFMAMTDRAGSANLRTTTFGASYAAKIRLTEKWVLSPGLTFGYGTRQIDLDKLVFGDQIIYNGPTTDDAIRTLGSRNYFDFSSGVVIYNKMMWAGMSAYHLNEPNHSLLGEDSKVPMRFSFHGGIKIPIKHGPLSESRLASISPSFVYSVQGEFQHLDIGANMVFDPIMVGLWYRGVPTGKNYSDKKSHDAAIFILGLNLKYFEAAYSYDFTISEIGPNSGGSHEISIIMLLTGLKRNKVAKKDKFLPCPNHTGFQWRE
jgi:type IX secretion system PorP/SprF family membrane protein